MKLWCVLLGILLLLGGCSSKHVFTPKKLAGSVDYSGVLPSSIIQVNQDGATLENGQFITHKGIQTRILPKGFTFLSDNETSYIASNTCGDLLILDKNSATSKQFSFSHRIVSAKMEHNLLALVTQENALILKNLENNKTVYHEKGEDTYAHDVEIASPVFLNDLVLFPSLDGKIVIVDKHTYKHVRILVVDSEDVFNNVIFLDVLQNRLVAATPRKIISVSPDLVQSYVSNIRDVLFLRNAIYVFTKEGRVILLDIDLNFQKEKQYDFAHFTGVMHGKYIYGIEKEGYLIANDPELVTSQIFQLADKIDSKIFVSKNVFYVNNRYFELNYR
jgi:hypothetical protein